MFVLAHVLTFMCFHKQQSSLSFKILGSPRDPQQNNRVSHMYKRCPNMYLYWTLLPHSTQTKKINYLINLPFEEEAKNNNKTKKQNKNYTILFQQAASLSLLLTHNSNFSTLSTIAECVRREHGKLG